MLKEIPPPSAALLFRPETDTDYVHFENAAHNKFADTAEGFSRVNAWWLADAALLAYWDEVPAAPIWNRAGLSFTPVSNEGVQCHIGTTDRFTIVSFRGTQPDDWHDLFDIVRIRQIDWESGGKVHDGFMKAHRRIWPKLASTLAELKPRKVWFTGHSLGAALATLSMDQYEGAKCLYTIGSPPVGNRDFARRFNRRHRGRSFRYVNHLDIVVHLTGWLSFLLGSYSHIEERRYIDGQGVISPGSPSILQMLSLPRISRVAPHVPRGLSHSTLLPGVLIDHTPRRYAVHIWNDYDRHLPVRVGGAEREAATIPAPA